MAGAFSKMFAGTAGVIFALIFFLVVAPLMLCGGCIVFSTWGVATAKREADKLAEEARVRLKEKEIEEAKRAAEVVPEPEPIPIEPAPKIELPDPDPSPAVVEAPPVNSFKSEARTWTSKSGTFKVEAKFIRYKNGMVALEKEDGSEIEVAAEKLSDDDRAWIDARRNK